jgi:MerR family transcriptional regulator, light-induced transcriptional regulator
MYTIKQASVRSGVTVPLLRAWERRYGVVAPDRTPSGYRLYDDAAIERLRAMRVLVDGGWSPSQAAAQVRDAGEEQLRALEEEIRASRGQPAAGEALLADGSAFVAAAVALDPDGMERALDEIFAMRRFEAAVDDVVLPAMASIGAAWARGEVDVAGEHAASSLVHRRLAIAFEAAGDVPGAPRLLVGLPHGARHELAALAFAVAARRAGIDAIYLGADVPTDSWALAAIETEARGVALGAVMLHDAEEASAAFADLERRRPGTLRAVGGRYAASVAGADLVLPDGVSAAVAAVLGAWGAG